MNNRPTHPKDSSDPLGLESLFYFTPSHVRSRTGTLEIQEKLTAAFRYPLSGVEGRAGPICRSAGTDSFHADCGRNLVGSDAAPGKHFPNTSEGELMKQFLAFAISMLLAGAYHLRGGPIAGFLVGGAAMLFCWFLDAVINGEGNAQ